MQKKQTNIFHIPNGSWILNPDKYHMENIFFN